MAVTETEIAVATCPTKIVPGSLQSSWQVAHTDPQQEENSGSRVRNPEALTDASIGLIDTRGLSTSMLIRMKYQAATVTQQPQVNVFGQDSNGVWMQLTDEDGNIDITLTATVGSDLTDGTDSFTPAKEIDLKGCTKVLVAMMTQLTGTTLSSDEIWVKFF